MRERVSRRYFMDCFSLLYNNVCRANALKQAGAKAPSWRAIYAALKRRSSTVTDN
jgi:hypothetical protein